MRLLWQSIDWQSYARCYLISNLNAMSILTGKEVSDDLFRKFIKDMLAIKNERTGNPLHNPKYWKEFTIWPKFTLKRRKENMGDIIRTREIAVRSQQYSLTKDYVKNVKMLFKKHIALVFYKLEDIKVKKTEK